MRASPLAEAIAAGIGASLRQSYERHEGGWWLFNAGAPKRALTDEEVQWHVERKHQPFVPDGVAKDDLRWWNEPTP
jgi:hypothetical protein